MYKYKKAVACINKALEIDLEIFGYNHPRIGESYCNLGHVYLQMGKEGESLKCLLKSLNIISNSFGNHHITVAGSLTNMGILSC